MGVSITLTGDTTEASSLMCRKGHSSYTPGNLSFWANRRLQLKLKGLIMIQRKTTAWQFAYFYSPVISTG